MFLFIPSKNSLFLNLWSIFVCPNNCMLFESNCHEFFFNQNIDHGILNYMIGACSIQSLDICMVQSRQELPRHTSL
jgi:hypothetical protein